MGPAPMSPGNGPGPTVPHERAYHERETRTVSPAGERQGPSARHHRLLALLLVAAGVSTGWGVLALPSGDPSPSGPGRPGAARSAQGGAGGTTSIIKGRSVRAPLRVLSIDQGPPPAGQAGGFGPVVVRFSSPLAAETRGPDLEPAIPGSWRRVGSSTLEFASENGFVTPAAEVVTVGTSVRDVDGARLSSPVVRRLPVPDAATLGAQELLAELGYLPVRFAASRRFAGPRGGSGRAPPASGTVAAVAGRFSWRFSATPAPLARLWHPGSYGVVTQGAVMTFERTHHMIVNRQLSETLLSDIERAKLAGSDDPRPYSYVLVREAPPETLAVYLNGRKALSSLANTGLDGSTPIGTWAVYDRNAVQTLRGTYPDGTPYVVPNVHYINYFDGNFAVHAFVRASYGRPQSAGCVEVPPAAGRVVWDDIGYGTLVTVLPATELPATGLAATGPPATGLPAGG
ncbi:MAG: L,D-transpeptidase [Acidimicrobiales bacterium]